MRNSTPPGDFAGLKDSQLEGTTKLVFGLVLFNDGWRFFFLHIGSRPRLVLPVTGRDLCTLRHAASIHADIHPFCLIQISFRFKSSHTFNQTMSKTLAVAAKSLREASKRFHELRIPLVGIATLHAYGDVGITGDCLQRDKPGTERADGGQIHHKPDV